jgi:hypothetical protein
MSEKSLKEYLKNITKDNLVKKMKVAGLKYTGLDKTAIVGSLEEFLLNEQSIDKIWNSLSPFEREYLDEFLKYEETPKIEKLKYMYEKHDVKGSYIREIWEGNSKMNLLFIGKVIPLQIKELLKKYLTPIVIKYNALEQLTENDKYRFNIIAESFAEDLCSVINLASSVDLSLTKEKQLPSKSTITKINSVLCNKDFVFNEVVLQEYLSILGVVDTVIYESEGGCSDYDYRPFFKVEYFRVTPLGAFVLGMSKNFSYEEKVTGSGFTVENSFEIKVIDIPSNQVHKLFFEQFAYKEEHQQYCIYKISFTAVVRALDKNITLESIIEYIRSYSLNEIPSELVTAIHKWKKDSDKVVIRNITVLQTENIELMEELQKDHNIIKYMVNDLACAFEIDPNSASKVKREIEKKEYYCKH